MSKIDKPLPNPVWRSPTGEIVSCVEKIKVLRENLEEIRDISQDAFEDALLMDCDEQQIRELLKQLVDQLENPYPKT